MMTDLTEPTFELVGHDPEAPATILFWAERRRARLIREIPDEGEMSERLKDELDQCTRAEQVAWSMQAYQRQLDMSAKDASYHMMKLDEARKALHEAMRFAQMRGIAIVPEQIDRAVLAASKLYERIENAGTGPEQLVNAVGPAHIPTGTVIGVTVSGTVQHVPEGEPSEPDPQADPR